MHYGCYLGCHARILHVFLLFSLNSKKLSPVCSSLLQFALVCPIYTQSQTLPRTHGVKSGSRVSGRGRALPWVTVGHESWRVGSRGVLIAWQERSSRQAPFLLRAFPRPASPVRFRPSLPGVFDPGDELVGPLNRLVNILEHGQALCEGGVHLIPSLSLGNGRRPGLRPPVGEKP